MPRVARSKKTTAGTNAVSGQSFTLMLVSQKRTQLNIIGYADVKHLKTEVGMKFTVCCFCVDQSGQAFMFPRRKPQTFLHCFVKYISD